jgi:hypothetical protein
MAPLGCSFRGSAWLTPAHAAKPECRQVSVQRADRVAGAWPAFRPNLRGSVGGIGGIATRPAQ